MKNFTFSLLIILLLSGNKIDSQILNLPARPVAALSGQEFVNLVASMNLTDRENEIYNQVMSGNVPDFIRTLVSVTNTENIGGTSYTFTYYVTPEYLAIGSNDNYFLCPMTPILAQRIASATNTIMPTKKMVDKIWDAAPVHLSPSTIPASEQMTTIPVMAQHNTTVWNQRQALLGSFPLGKLVGGHKKDVIISNRIYGNPAPGRVVIYGWHYTSGTPIQPVYAGHDEKYADYSHGIRLVQNNMTLNGVSTTVQAILTSFTLSSLLSDEGVISVPNYPDGTPAIPKPVSFAVVNDGERQLKVLVSSSVDITHYLVKTSGDGITFSEAVEYPKNAVILSELEPNKIVFLKIAAKTATKTSVYSEVLGAVPSAEKAKVLIVNGFDRATAANTYDYIRQHGEAVFDNNYNFVSCTNDALTYNLIDPKEYPILDIILGEESTADLTFSNQEQTIIANYLKQGGNLFVSGSEIAWDLDQKGSAADKSFFTNYLKAAYKNDSPNGQNGVYYSAQPTSTSIFSGLGSVNFDNGTKGTYNVVYPDELTPVGVATPCLQYANLTNSYAGINFDGVFSGGSKDSKLVYFGVPFETFYPKEARKNVMAYILSYFNVLSSGIENQEATENYSFKIFPNPFSNNITVELQKENERGVLKIYDMSNKEVYSNTIKESTTLDLAFLTQGVYFLQLQTKEKAVVEKLIKH